jgi:hypothetical protein
MANMICLFYILIVLFFVENSIGFSPHNRKFSHWRETRQLLMNNPQKSITISLKKDFLKLLPGSAKQLKGLLLVVCI